MIHMLKIVAFSTLLLLLGGCVFIFTTGHPIDEADVESISPGETSKYDLIEQFGTPLSITPRGEKLLVQAPHADYGLNPRPFYGFLIASNSDSQFELFADKHTFTPYHRVYHFQHYQSSGYLLYLIFWVHSSNYAGSNDLWALVDEETGLVTDHFYMRR